MLLLDVKQVVAVHVVEGLAGGDPAWVDLEDGLGRLAVPRVDLDVECIARYGHDLLLYDELGLLVRIDELGAPDGRVHGLESTHAGDVCLVSSVIHDEVDGSGVIWIDRNLVVIKKDENKTSEDAQANLRGLTCKLMVNIQLQSAPRDQGKGYVGRQTWAGGG